MISKKFVIRFSTYVLITLLPKFASAACSSSNGVFHNDCKSGYRLMNKPNCGSENVECSIADTNDQYLYDCPNTDNPDCKLVTKVGYYIQGETYYSCKIVNYAVLCSAITPGTVDNNCASSNGLLVADSNDNTVKFCKDTVIENAIKFSDNSNSFEFTADATENIFGLISGQSGIITTMKNKYIILDLDLPLCTVENNICKVGGEIINKEKKYCITASGQIYKTSDGETDGTCTVQFGNKNFDEGLKAIVMDETADTLVAFNEEDNGLTVADNSLVLYDCAYGKCIRTYGVVIINNVAYESKPSSSGAYTTNEACSTGDDVGKIIYTTDPSSFKICTVDEITFTGSDPTLSKVDHVNIEEGKYIFIKPEAGYSTPHQFFGKQYINSAMVKTTAKSATLSMHSPELPVCDSSCKVNSNSIDEGNSCIDANGAIYVKGSGSTCTKVYGKEGGAGVKIFQHVVDFNAFKEVTTTLEALDMTDIKDEMPILLIYECSTSSCRQTSGFVRYKLKENDAPVEYMVCKTQRDTDLYVGYTESGVINAKFILDTTTAANADCNVNKAKTGTYRTTSFNGDGIATFDMCFIPMIEGTDTGKERYVSLTLNKNEELQFFYTNGETPFPDTKKGDNVLVKIYGQYAILASEASIGYTINSASVYKANEDQSKDGLIYCTDTTLDKCTVKPIVSGYYLNAGPDKATKPIIACNGTSCKTIAVTANECSKVAAGGMIKDSSNKYKICLSTTDSIELKVDSSEQATYAYESLTIATANDFPGAEVGPANIKVLPDGSALLLKKLELPECNGNINSEAKCYTSAPATESYCYHIKSGSIYKSLGDTCTETFGKSKIEEDVKVFDADTATLVTSLPTSLTEGTRYVLYDCGYGRCVQTYGYVKIGTQSNTRIYEVRSYDLVDVTEQLTKTECKTLADVGNLLFTKYSASRKRAATNEKLEICTASTVTLSSASPSISVAPTTVSNGQFYNIKNWNSVNGSGTFAGETFGDEEAVVSSSNSGNILALYQSGYQLPNCEKEIVNNEFCIKDDKKIYKDDKKTETYGKDGGSGVKIFLRKGQNSYEEVVMTNTGEDNPQFVIYDCSTSSCVQTDGIVKFKKTSSDTAFKFTKCSAKIGCQVLTPDSSSSTCNEAKASLTTYKYTDYDSTVPASTGTLELCLGVKINGVTSYKPVTLTVTQSTTKLFTFVNGDAVFLGVEAGENVLLKVASEAITQTNDITKGYHVNAGTIYGSDTSNKGNDAAFICEKDNDVSTCSVVAAPSASTTNYYVSSDKSIITCTNFKCTVGNGVVKPAAYISASDTTHKTVIVCDTASECSEISNAAYLVTKGPLYYVDSADNKKIITCNDDNGCTSSDRCSSLGTDAAIYFIDGSDDKNVIKCEKAGCTKHEVTENTETFNDAGEVTKTIICVKNNSCVSSKVSATCSDVTETAACKLSNSLSVEKGNYCMKDKKLYMTTDGPGCTAVMGTSEAPVEILLKEGTNGYVKGRYGLNSGLIYTCTNTECSQLLSTYYLSIEPDSHGNINRFLYYCNNDGDCYMDNRVSEGYYLSNIPSIANPIIIKCSKDEFSSCILSTETIDSDPIFSVENGYYLDQGNKKNVIKCDGTCSSLPGSTEQGYAYVDQTNTKNVIICNKDTGCSSVLGNTTENHAYIDAGNNKKIIMCTETGCSNPAEHATDAYYIDATDPIYTIKWPQTGECTTSNDCRVQTGVNCKDKTYYLVADKTNFFLQTNVNQNSFLYYCAVNENSVVRCNEVYEKGYYINDKDNVYSCNGTSGQCKASTEGNGVVGKITAVSDERLVVFLNTGISAPLQATPKNYLVATGTTADNAFGTSQAGENAIITVGENYVHLNSTFSYTQDHYVYINSATQEILKSGVCPAGGFAAIEEYTCNPTTSVCTLVS